jgi:hypothetical protein
MSKTIGEIMSEYFPMGQTMRGKDAWTIEHISQAAEEYANQKLSEAYTREEVISILKKFADDCEHDESLFSYAGRDSKGEKNFVELEKWTQENLK